MFCIHCGKQIVDNASFCAFCGKPTPSKSSNNMNLKQPQEWEYTFYARHWKSGKGGRWNLLLGTTEYSVRLDNWGRHENLVMSEIQEFLDKGWEFVTKPGPNSYTFVRHQDYASGVTFNWLELSTFVVNFRRPIQERTKKEKQLLGLWQETTDPNKGIWKKLGNAIFDRKLEVKRWEYEFKKDRTFRRTDHKNQERDGGCFYEHDGELHMSYKFSPRLDSIVAVHNNKLIMKRKNKDLYDQEYERRL